MSSCVFFVSFLRVCTCSCLCPSVCLSACRCARVCVCVCVRQRGSDLSLPMQCSRSEADHLFSGHWCQPGDFVVRGRTSAAALGVLGIACSWLMLLPPLLVTVTHTLYLSLSLSISLSLSLTLTHTEAHTHSHTHTHTHTRAVSVCGQGYGRREARGVCHFVHERHSRHAQAHRY